MVVWVGVVTDVDVQILFDMGHMLLWVWIVSKVRLRMWLVVWVRVWLVMRVWHWLGIHLLGMRMRVVLLGMGMRVVLLECAFLESEGELRKLFANFLSCVFGLGRLHRLWLLVPWCGVMLGLRLVPWIV